MAIITAAGLSDLYYQRTFNKNGSTVTLKKISETDWLLFGDLAEGDSEGFGGPSLSCESQPSWDQEFVTFGVSMGEPFWADSDYSMHVNAFFAYDSTSTRQQTGGFTTIPPEGVDWMLMGWDGDGGAVIMIKPLDGFPMVSIGMEAQIELYTDEGFTRLRASRETESDPYYGVEYEHEVEYAPNKTVCAQMSILGMT